MKKLIGLFAVLSVFVACTPTTNVQENLGAVEYRGEKITVGKVMTYNQMLTKLEKKGGLEGVQVEGKVREVCQKKGCWMTLYSDDNQKEMVVKFKDYGFFMPLDISGKTVIMEGKAYKETTSVDELRHYAEDAGKSKDEIAKITEPKVELKFEATGVIIKQGTDAKKES